MLTLPQPFLSASVRVASPQVSLVACTVSPSATSAAHETWQTCQPPLAVPEAQPGPLAVRATLSQGPRAVPTDLLEVGVVSSVFSLAVASLEARARWQAPARIRHRCHRPRKRAPWRPLRLAEVQSWLPLAVFWTPREECVAQVCEGRSHRMRSKAATARCNALTVLYRYQTSAWHTSTRQPIIFPPCISQLRLILYNAVAPHSTSSPISRSSSCSRFVRSRTFRHKNCS